MVHLAYMRRSRRRRHAPATASHGSTTVVVVVICAMGVLPCHHPNICSLRCFGRWWHKNVRKSPTCSSSYSHSPENHMSHSSAFSISPMMISHLTSTDMPYDNHWKLLDCFDDDNNISRARILLLCVSEIRILRFSQEKWITQLLQSAGRSTNHTANGGFPFYSGEMRTHP